MRLRQTLSLFLVILGCTLSIASTTGNVDFCETDADCATGYVCTLYTSGEYICSEPTTERAQPLTESCEVDADCGDGALCDVELEMCQPAEA